MGENIMKQDCNSEKLYAPIWTCTRHTHEKRYKENVEKGNGL